MEAVPRDGELNRPAVTSHGGWCVEEVVGSAAGVHGREPELDGTRRAWWCTVDAPALVLGSAQPEATVDIEACRRAGVPIVRRRSGGGAVLVVPGELLWLDVVVPRGDPLWDDDVGRSMWWLGEVWADALRSSGIDARVHRSALQRSRWSSVVCFDGVGAGEVLVGDAKAIGISQRRTRDWARLQSSVHLRWRPELLVALLAEPRPVVGDLRDVWTSPLDATRLRDDVERALGER